MQLKFCYLALFRRKTGFRASGWGRHMEKKRVRHHFRLSQGPLRKHAERNGCIDNTREYDAFIPISYEFYGQKKQNYAYIGANLTLMIVHIFLQILFSYPLALLPCKLHIWIMRKLSRMRTSIAEINVYEKRNNCVKVAPIKNLRKEK